MKAPFSIPKSVLTFAGSLLLPLAGLSQDLPYSSGSTEVDQALAFRTIYTPARYSHTMVFHADKQEMILFGGSGPQGTYGDTWSWNGTIWRAKTSPATPPARNSHAMAYDAANKETVMFGGTGPVNYSDTWIWDGTAWDKAAPANSPSARYGHAMAYDAKNSRVVLFGGTVPGVGNSNETWLWDGTNWTLASPTTSPSARPRMAMAYDEDKQVIVLYGGENFGDTWIWDGQDWTLRTPLTSPPGLAYAAMAYDGNRKGVVLYGGYPYQIGGSGNNQTWFWNGTIWTLLTPADQPGGRYSHCMAWDSTRNKVVLTGAYSGSDDTWLLGASNWEYWSSSTQFFDMSTRPAGVWNFTTIDVPPGVNVYFRNNPANVPVRWLASGNVTINGFLNLNGEPGQNNNANPGNESKGGPGGYPGGLAAIRFDQSSTYTGNPGQGPGGGAPGVGAQDGWNNGLIYGKQGAYSSSYGNAYLQPLLGGSGGGGGGSAFSATYGNGGGGGGAILISSSKDITVNGSITANGGGPGTYGGQGSGGGIRLVADRVSGGGSLSATPEGRIRIEGFYRALAGNASPVASLSAPIATRTFDNSSSLVVSKVAGANVPQPPSGNSASPDVIFTAPGQITVEVKSTGLPENTPVRLRVTTATGVINKPAEGEPEVKLVGGVATFTVTVPSGLGTIQGFAEFTQQ